MRSHVIVLACVGASIASSCRAPGATTPQRRGVGQAPRFQAPGNDPWKLTWRDPTNQQPALLWNGLIGIRLSPTGSGIGQDGKPLPFFMIDSYESEGEEKIRTLPNPLSLSCRSGVTQLWPTAPRNLKQYESRLDLKSGVIVNRWKQDIKQGEVEFRVTTALHGTAPVLTQEWHVQGPAGTPIKFDLSPQPPIPLSSTSSGPAGTMAIYRADTGEIFELLVTGPDRWTDQFDFGPTRGGRWSTTLPTGGKYLRIVARASRSASLAAEGDPRLAFARALSEAQRTNARRSAVDIELDGPIEDQQAVRSWHFYLRSAIHPDGNMAISPFGLSRARYNGHVFWDADLWVFPALAFVDPAAASQIPKYRLDRMRAAQENFRAWQEAGYPLADGRVGPDTALHNLPIRFKSPPATRYPWESSVSGKESATGPTKSEHHVTGSIEFAYRMAEALRLAPPVKPGEAFAGAFAFYLHRIEKRPDGLYDLRGVVSPDEFHTGDNDLYTNLLAQWCINGGKWSPPMKGWPQLHLPKDGNSFLTYDGDDFRGYKQAAAVLAIYPLQYPPAEGQARAMMERFEPKVIKGGPAMSDSIHALIWARLGEPERAYQTWRKSWMDFSRPPHLLFSEERDDDLTYFTTGAAGCLQSVIYGFMGFRIDSKKLPGAAWSLKLDGERWLSVKPNLPRAWKRLTFRNFTMLGKRYTLTATHDSLQVTRGD